MPNHPSLAGKKIILAVTGSIAAYKTPGLVRLLLKAGAEVRVILTPAAASFVSPLALSTVAKHPVYNSVHDGADWNNHVELGLWADAMLIAPCSANTLAKLAGGLCDTLVNAVYLSARCPIFIAPAMDEDMWIHPSTRANVERLRSWGNYLVPVGHGELASGLIGEGRMAEPEELVAFLGAFFKEIPKPLTGKKFLVTAGPTYERLDPVRFIGNFSTGKMGIAIAEGLAAAGAEVSLVLGPTHLRPERFLEKIETVLVESAEEMFAAATRVFPSCDGAILSAAVADYRPAEVQPEKIKKGAGDTNGLTLALVKNKDILAHLGQSRRQEQVLVGFALETENEEANAREKQVRKGADLIVLNSLKDEGAGFGTDTNKVNFVTADAVEKLPLLSKAAVADAIVHWIANRILTL
jgi:phosphopantothenoylcysteine decarboxylase/phosphopantothenate--cysteine ligase